MSSLTLQQFRGACAVVDSGFNISRAATKLHTTQSALSRTIKGLEDQLGAAVFVRSAVRVVGLTAYGHEFLELARGILRDTELAAIRAREDILHPKGVLRIGTTHLHASYVLPAVIRSFREKYPEMTIEIEQADAREVAGWVLSRAVHIGISEPYSGMPHGFIALSAMQLDRCIAVPTGHELLATEMPTIADVARFPLIAFSEPHTAGCTLRALLREAGLAPRIVVTASDATVLREYVAAGLGIAILHRIAIRPEDAGKIATIDATHLMPPTETRLLIRRGEYFRTYLYDFIQILSPQWSLHSILDEIAKQTTAGEERANDTLHSPPQGNGGSTAAGPRRPEAPVQGVL